MKGATVFSGYYKRPDKTSEAFDAQGWLKTGDVALIYPNGSAKIIDRSKNIFKLSQGEYIAPEKLENIFSLSPLIAQTFIYGDSLRSCTVAVIVPELDKVKDWGRENGKSNISKDCRQQHGRPRGHFERSRFQKARYGRNLETSHREQTIRTRETKGNQFHFERF